MTATLVYLTGASGSGKDSLLGYARHHLAAEPGVAFAHRYITRTADAGGENHVALSPREFEARLAARLFALHWRSHGFAYAIGVEIDQWLARGVTVVVNGSRDYLAQARRRYPAQLLPVRIEVSADCLRQRLLARGRENAAQIEDRLARHHRLQAEPFDGMVIRNDERLEQAGETLVTLIRRHSGRVPCG